MITRRDSILSHPHGPKASVAGQKRLERLSSTPRLKETDSSCERYEWKTLEKECVTVIRLVGDGCRKR